MAIEFNCPYCTSTIRVPDGASGKRGRCPRCNEQLIVPEVRQSAPPKPPAVETSADRPSIPEMPNVAVTPPVVPAPAPSVPNPVSPPALFEPTTTPAIAPAAATTRTQRPRRRSANMPLAMSILGLCFAVIVGLAGYLWWPSRPTILEGSLDGEIVDKSVLSSVTVPAGDINVADDKRRNVLRSLADLAYSLKSNLLATEFFSRGNEFEVRIMPTPSTMLVRVSPTLNEDLKQWIEENRDRIAAKRSSDLREASSKFFTDYNPLDTVRLPRSEQGYYRNRLALGVLNPGLGYVVEAKTATQICPSVFEDSIGNVYFAVPRGTGSFQIQGRSLDGTTIFPGTFVVTCYRPDQAEAVEPPQSPPETQESKEGRPQAKEPGGESPESSEETNPPAGSSMSDDNAAAK